MSDLMRSARRTATGMALQALEDREDDADELMQLYMAEAKELGVAPCMALVGLVRASLGLALSVTADTEAFHRIAEGLAVSHE